MNGSIGDKRVQQLMARSESFNIFDRQSDRISRIGSYCNPFTTIKLNEELHNISALIPDLSLSKVLVMIRHGDRGPLRPVKRLSSISCDPFISLKSYNFQTLFKRYFSEAKDRLRTRLSTSYALTPSSGCRIGHLSRFGCVQHLTLGSLLGQYYGNRLNISSYNLKVYSTPYPRTFQSAVAFIFGFLNPMSVIEFKQFPQIESTFGTFFCTYPEFCSKKCTKLEKIQNILNEEKHQLLSSNRDIVKLIAKIKPIIAYNSNVSKLFDSPIAIFDGLMAYMCHNSALPCDDKRCVTVEEAKQLVFYIELHGKHLAASQVFKHSNWFKIYGFLHHLVKQITNLENKKKFILYSGHDITIVALAAALDFFDGIIPPYASRVVFEAYKHKSGDNYLRVIYNGKDVTHFTEICKLNPTKCLYFTQKHNIFLINVKDFSDFIVRKFESFTQTLDYQTACL